MKIERFLEKICSEIKDKSIKKEISHEIENHIYDKKNDFIFEGYKENEAEEKAIEEMGDPILIGKNLNKIYKPKLNYLLLIIISVLSIFGILTSFYKYNDTNIGYMGNTILYIILSAIIGTLVYFFNYKKLQKFSDVVYLIGISFILLSFTRLSVYLDGKQYIRIFNVSFSPFFISIPLLIVAISGFYSNYNRYRIKTYKFLKYSIKLNRDFIKIFLCSMLSILLMIAASSLEYTIILIIVYLILYTVNVLKTFENRRMKIILMYGIFTFVTITIMLLSTTGKIHINLIDFKDDEFIEIKKEILYNSKYFGESEIQLSSEDTLKLSNNSKYTLLYLVSKIGKIPVEILLVCIYMTNVVLFIAIKEVKDSYGKNILIGINILLILQAFFNLISIIFNLNFDFNIPLVSYGTIYFFTTIILFALVLSIYKKKNVLNLHEKCGFYKI